MPDLLILASQSPRRAELLGQTGLNFVIDAPECEEITCGTAEYVAAQNALLKAKAAAQVHPDAYILAADTVVESPEGEIFGKPASKQDAFRMLRALSGKNHRVLTGVCLMHGAEVSLGTDSTLVSFVPMTDGEIEGYIASGEPFDKAGAYALQGIAGMFIDKISGSYSNVIGLPMAMVRDLLKKAGFFA